MPRPGGSLITAVILTLDEEPNIARALSSLEWVESIVILDSGSRDETRSIAETFSNVKWYQRPFDTHARQWAYALFETGIETEFALALDADMSVPEALARELNKLTREGIDGAVIPFTYCLEGVPLLGSVYPSQLRLLRLSRTTVKDDGHTQRFEVGGPTAKCRERMLHDDRKPFARWVASQVRYSEIEGRRLFDGDAPLSWKQLLRLYMPFCPELIGLYAYLRSGGPLSGAASRRYARERLLYEVMLRWRVEHERLLRGQGTRESQHHMRG